LMMHSSVIELDGDTANVSTLLHESGTSTDGEDIDVVGRYEDRIVRHDGKWYFAERVFYPLMLRLPATFTTPAEGSIPIGTRWP